MRARAHTRHTRSSSDARSTRPQPSPSAFFIAQRAALHQPVVADASCPAPEKHGRPAARRRCRAPSVRRSPERVPRAPICSPEQTQQPAHASTRGTPGYHSMAEPATAASAAGAGAGGGGGAQPDFDAAGAPWNFLALSRAFGPSRAFQVAVKIGLFGALSAHAAAHGVAGAPRGASPSRTCDHFGSGAACSHFRRFPPLPRSHRVRSRRVRDH